MKLVSVIMPAYNCEKYISEAIESVINQTYKNWELIIINDCSIDATGSVITQYEQRDRRIRSLTNDVNKGVALTRLKGIENAKGEYIALLDSDDRWKSNKTALQMELMKDKSVILSYTGYDFIDENSMPLGYAFHVPKRVSYKQMLYRNYISCDVAIVKKDVIEKAYLQLPKADDNTYHEDYVAWLGVLKQSSNVAVGIDQALASYRLSRNSKTGNKLRSAKMHYRSLVLAGINPIHAAYYFLFYAVNGIRKYRK